MNSNLQLEKVGEVTVEEKDQIQQLFNRRKALQEMVMVLQENSARDGQVDDVMYEKVVADLGKTSEKFQNWWDEKAKKYNWKSRQDGQWQINFETCEITLAYAG